MADFSKYRIDEVCEFTNGFAFKSGDYIEKSKETLEVFRMGYIERGGGFKEDSTPVFVPKNYGRDLSKYLLRKDDVLIAMTDMKNNVAILANTARIKDEGRFVLNQRVGCLRVIDKNLLDPTFFYFYSNFKPHVEYLRSRANSGVQVNLSTSSIKEAEILVPPITEQKAIASVLGTLDDKIENNRQMNQTLEEMACHFQSWFVDFDLFAKAAGNAPAHMDAETAALFPNSFGDDGLPVGWQKVYLKDLTNIVYGKNLPTKKLVTSGYPVFGGNGVIGFFSEYLYEKPQVLVACRGAASGKVIRSLPFSFVTNNSLVIEITAPHLNRFYLELYLRDLTLEGFVTGSAQPQMTIANMDAVKLLNPTKEVLHCFEILAEPLFDKVLANDKENQTLAELRDTLLPKLMSGEIRVKDAEREVEGAV